MAIDTRHPLYLERQDDWRQLRDTYEGAKAVMAAGTRYLPATAGMIEDGFGVSNAETKGNKAYAAYRKRAVFAYLVQDAVRTRLGNLHMKPPEIQLPRALEPMRRLATNNRESLEMLLRRINEAQLVTGRLGLLGDVRSGPGRSAVPRIVTYEAEGIINWNYDQDSGDPTMVVLDETGPIMDPETFVWRNQERFRLLRLSGGSYVQGAFNRDDGNDDFPVPVEALRAPTAAGRTLPRIPFHIVNPQDTAMDPDVPPLLGLSDLDLTIYRCEADYRQALFMQGQDTLVVIGGQDDDKAVRLGAGARLNVPIGGDAKFIGVDSSGLPEMRTGLENDYTRAGRKAGDLLDESTRERESGQALRVRVTGRTVTLQQIAVTGAFALEQALRDLAAWVGANPEEVSVKPNLDFVEDTMSGQDLGEIMAAKMEGSPHSLKSIHALMAKRGMTEMTFEEELEAIAAEIPLVTPSSDADGPESDGDTE